MKWITFLLLVLIATSTATPARAQSFSFSVVARVQATDAPFDPNAPSLQQVPSGGAVRLTIYYNFQSVPANCQASDRYLVVDQTGKTLLDKTYQETCPSSGSSGAYYYGPSSSTGMWPTVSGSGTWAFTGSVAITDPSTNNTVTQSGQATFTVVPSSGGATPTPTPPPTVVPTRPLPTATPTPTPTAIPTRPPTATPRPRKVQTRFTIISVRVEKFGAKPDWNLVRPPLKHAKVGAKLQISTYYSVHSAPARAPITVHVTLRSGGQTISRTYHDKLAARPVDTYREWVRWTPPAGKYAIIVQISSGGVTHGGQVAFAVLRKGPAVVPTKSPTALPHKTPVTPHKTPVVPHKTPTALPPPSFSFDNLRAFNAKGQPQSSFKVGERLGWKVNYTVRNLPTKVTATIIVNYQNPTNGGWRPYAPPDNFGLTVSNGPNVYTNSLVIPRDYPYPSLRIVVGVTIGSKTRIRDVTVRITR